MSYKFFKTIDPNLYNLNIFYEKDLYSKATNYGLLLTSGIELLEDFIEYQKSLVGFDPIQQKTDVFKNINDSKFKKYKQAQFKVFWFEKYLTSITPVKNRLKLELEGKINLFKNISDTIGRLRNVEYLIDDSLLAIFDVDFDLTTDNFSDQLVPINYSTTIQNKLKPNTKLLTSYMSRFVTSTFRHNMYQLSEPYSDSKQSHGSNLVSDYYHYERIYNIAKEELESELSKFYNDLYDIILFYENYELQNEDDNMQIKDKGSISFTLEGLEKTTDYMKKEVGFYKNILTSIQILGVDSV